jgi:hypothetical protein
MTCVIVCVHSWVSSGVTVMLLPSKSKSSASDLYWTAPCSLTTLPVLVALVACKSVVHRLTCSPLLAIWVFGVTVPLRTFLSYCS